MKEFQLSTPKERVAGISFSVAMIVAFFVLLFAVRKNTILLIFTGIGVVLLTATMVFYIVSILKSKCIVDTEKKILEVKGYPSYTKDISDAVLLETLPRKSGHAVTRVLVFSDAKGDVVAMVPTLYTYKQGILADPMAKEMADALGIEFQRNVPEWQYNKEKYQEHLKEEAEQEKIERKERMEMRRKKLLYRYRNK